MEYFVLELPLAILLDLTRPLIVPTCNRLNVLAEIWVS